MLFVAESTEKTRNKSTDPGEDPGADAVTSSLLWVYIVVALVLIVPIASFIIFHLRKITQAASLFFCLN